jgi:hypothetical protein
MRVRLGAVLVAATAIAGLAACSRGSETPPATTPSASVAASTAPPEVTVPSVAPFDVATSPSPSPSAAAAGAPGAVAAEAPAGGAAGAAAPGASPSASPGAEAEAAKRAEQEKQVRADVAAAKAQADALAAQASSECPDLKPGEMRHPGAVARCNQLRNAAAAAAQAYETAKRTAQSAGITVQ